MTEVIGECISVTDTVMMIKDYEGDDIEMCHIGMPEKANDYFKTLI